MPCSGYQHPVGIDIYVFSFFLTSMQNNTLKEIENLMAAVKMAQLSEVNHGKHEHTALGREVVFGSVFYFV